MALDTIVHFNEASIFQEDNLILSDVNLTIEKGEFVFLIGRVGSGKSSLIKTINAEIPLTKGAGSAVGYDLRKLKRKHIPQLRRKLGVVFQDFQLLIDRNIEENLRFVLRATGWKDKNKISQRIAEVLEKVGLEYKGYKMPHQLSGGEQQRVVIARALLNDPEIILADEPTGNLDPDTSIDILNILQEISQSGRAVLMATHNYSLLKRTTGRTFKCTEGKITEVKNSDAIDVYELM
jgi:cell division transport system ATP-binding protein